VQHYELFVTQGLQPADAGERLDRSDKTVEILDLIRTQLQNNRVTLCAELLLKELVSLGPRRNRTHSKSGSGIYWLHFTTTKLERMTLHVFDLTMKHGCTAQERRILLTDRRWQGMPQRILALRPTVRIRYPVGLCPLHWTVSPAVTSQCHGGI